LAKTYTWYTIRAIDVRKPIPLYLQITEDLRQKIAGLPADAQLESQSDLACPACVRIENGITPHTHTLGGALALMIFQT
jgi:hypothetical protein